MFTYSTYSPYTRLPIWCKVTMGPKATLSHCLLFGRMESQMMISGSDTQIKSLVFQNVCSRFVLFLKPYQLSETIKCHGCKYIFFITQVRDKLETI